MGTNMNLQSLAKQLDDAAHQAKGIEQLSLSNQISIQQAYEIQKLSIDLRRQRGEAMAGYKMGFTSKAKMQQMGVDDLIWGRLTDQMMIEEGGEIDLANYVHPRVEPEICFLMKKPLSGKVSLLTAMNAVEAIAPALEVIDSRYENFKFSLEDVVADNCSSSGFVIGPMHRPDVDFSNLGMIMQVNGRDVAFGSSAAILGHPARSLVAAARCLAEVGESLQPGQLLMAGAATEAIALAPGQSIQLQVDKLGRMGFSTNA
jgi:2-oxo-3-hexenedioate decarboxylase